MKVLSFEEYKKKGTLSYVEIEDNQEPVLDSKAGIELEELSYVMEMSTDELLGELTLRMHTGSGLRQIADTYIVDELTQRMVAMQYFLMLYTKSDFKS
jgi:hypothetical protein